MKNIFLLILIYVNFMLIYVNKIEKKYLNNY